MAIVTETGDSDVFDNPGQSMAVGDTFQGLSDINDANDAVFVALTEGQIYTITLTGLPADSAHFALYMDDFSGSVARITSNGLILDSNDLVRDLEISEDGYSFSFVAPASRTCAFGQERGTWTDGAVSYELTVAEFEAPAPTDGSDIFYGSDIGQDLNLGLGDDRYYGGSGDDIIHGSNGLDRLFGGEGNDTLRGGADDDRLNGGGGDDVLNGGTGRDKLRGGDGEDVLRGHDGNDLIQAGDGNDLLDGGLNNDRLYGGTGNDTIDAGHGNDRLYGNDDNDLMSGGLGKDAIDGGSGDDTLDGGAGRDRLTGGTGADVFVFGTDMQKDVITDFENGVDLLDFSAHGFTDLSALTLTQFGDDTRIIVDSANFVVLRDTDVADIGIDDFILSVI